MEPAVGFVQKLKHELLSDGARVIARVFSLAEISFSGSVRRGRLFGRDHRRCCGRIRSLFAFRFIPEFGKGDRLSAGADRVTIMGETHRRIRGSDL